MLVSLCFSCLWGCDIPHFQGCYINFLSTKNELFLIIFFVVHSAVCESYKNVCHHFIKDTSVCSGTIYIGQVAVANCDPFFFSTSVSFWDWEPDLHSLNAEFESDKLVYAFTDIDTKEEMLQCCCKSEVGQH